MLKLKHKLDDQTEHKEKAARTKSPKRFILDLEKNSARKRSIELYKNEMAFTPELQNKVRAKKDELSTLMGELEKLRQADEI